MGKWSVYSNLEKTALIEEWMTSGQTRSVFCESKNVSFETFGNWVSKYRKERNIDSRIRTRDLAPHFMPIEITKNIPVKIHPQVIDNKISLVGEEAFSEIEITYPTGAILKIGSEVSLEQLRILLNLI